LEIVDSLFLLLLGIVVRPMYCSQHILSHNKLYLEMDVSDFDIHEAFAGQILSTLKATASQNLPTQSLVTKRSVRLTTTLNTRGSSFALGHPFGVTGSWLVMTASCQLHQEEARFALVAALADGEMGHACILEWHDA
jgi:acetyl-CoA acetyltransferase